MGKKSRYEDGLALYYAQRFEEAVRFFDSAIDEDPHNFRGYLHRGNCHLGNRQAGLAAEDYRKAISLAPQEAAPHYYLAGLFLSKNDLPNAVTEWEKFLELAPPDHPERASIEGIVKAFRHQAG